MAAYGVVVLELETQLQCPPPARWGPICNPKAEHMLPVVDVLCSDIPAPCQSPPWPALGEYGICMAGSADLSQPRVAILLCTYQGRAFLARQLNSFALQRYRNWKVWSADDGSQDGTLDILQACRDTWGEDRLSVTQGPGKGPAANFLTLVCRGDIQAEYYAYSDQDDVWDDDKLERALACLRGVPQSTPALYCSRARLVDEQDVETGMTSLCGVSPSFSNALVQNLAGGNTMVFNKAARELLCAAGPDVDVPMHDWWTYLVVAGCGGIVIYDRIPSISYRQHSGNVVGEESGLLARFSRGLAWARGDFRARNGRNITALRRIEGKLSPQGREVLGLFVLAREEWLLPRLLGLLRAGIHRQTVAGTLFVYLAAILGKI